MLLHGDAAIAEARLLHPLQEGYFVLAQKTGEGRYGWKEKSFRMGLLEEAVSAVKRDPINRYISQASFVGPRRGVAHLHALRSAFIDMDCQQKLGVAPDAKFINSLLVRAGQIGIPEPTMIIRSGRGLYAKWIFDRSITAAQLDKWKLVNDALLDLFQDFGADMKVRDAARVLRVLGSTNSKANRGTEIVQLEHENPVLHDFDFLCSQVATASLIHGARKCDEQPKAERARRERIVERAKLLNEASPTDLRGLVDFEALRRPILVDDTGRGGCGRYGSRSKEGLNWRRFVDLRNLILARGGAPKGTRDQYVFWMLNHLCLSGMVAPGNFESEAQSLIHLFPRHDGFNPLEDGSLSTLSKKLAASNAGQHIEYRGKSYNPLYTPTNDYLINAFEITPTEEVGMTTIISSLEKQRRSDLHCPGRTERRQAREGRIEIIRQVLDSKPNPTSLPIGTLTEALGIGERQARRVANKTLGRGSREQVLAGRIGLARELLASGEHPDKVAEQMGITRRQLQRWIPQATVEQALRSLQRQGTTPSTPPPPPALQPPPSSPAIEAKTHTTPESRPTAPAIQRIALAPAHSEGDKPGGRAYRTLLPVSIRESGCLSKVLDPFEFMSVGGAQECCGPKIKLTKPKPKLTSRDLYGNGPASALVETETSPFLAPSSISWSSSIREDESERVAGWYGHGPPVRRRRPLRPLFQFLIHVGATQCQQNQPADYEQAICSPERGRRWKTGAGLSKSSPLLQPSEQAAPSLRRRNLRAQQQMELTGPRHKQARRLTILLEIPFLMDTPMNTRGIRLLIRGKTLKLKY